MFPYFPYSPPYLKMISIPTGTCCRGTRRSGEYQPCVCAIMEFSGLYLCSFPHFNKCHQQPMALFIFFYSKLTLKNIKFINVDFLFTCPSTCFFFSIFKNFFYIIAGLQCSVNFPMYSKVTKPSTYLLNTVLIEGLLCVKQNCSLGSFPMPGPPFQSKKDGEVTEMRKSRKE